MQITRIHVHLTKKGRVVVVEMKNTTEEAIFKKRVPVINRYQYIYCTLDVY